MLRFAPAPTGDMYIDSLRIALFNYLIAKQRNEDLLIRIEDIEKENIIDGKDQEILDILALFGIQYSQVTHQSQNLRFHSAMALDLLHKKKAFTCFCSHEWLEKKKAEAKELQQTYKYDDACRNLPAELVIDNTAPFTVRIVRPEEEIVVQDKIKGTLHFDADEVDSFIIMNQDKTPTHTFASAVDDMLNDISIIIHDEKYISDTPKQEHIRKQLGYQKTLEYAHLPTILHDDISVKWLLEQGFLPEAIANYLLLIGNDFPYEIFTLNEAQEWFDFKTIANSPTRFDIDVLKHINKEHLKMMDAKELSRYVGFADTDIGELARLYLNDTIYTTKELKKKIECIFAPRNISEVDGKYIDVLSSTIKQAPHFDEYNDFKNYIIKETNLTEEEFTPSLCVLLTNSKSCSDITKVYKYLKNYIGELVK